MDARCKTLGLARADQQWANADANGITKDARYWADDMYMITALQVDAYRVTKDAKYLTRAATTMLDYQAKLQQSDGLFWHTMTSKAYWGRANGWVAAGAAELLVDLPAGTQRDMVMAGFKKHAGRPAAAADQRRQRRRHVAPGAGREHGEPGELVHRDVHVRADDRAQERLDLRLQLLDGRAPRLARGRQQDQRPGPARPRLPRHRRRRPPGALQSQQQFYMTITLGSNDPHGQAPLLWSAHALLRTDCPGMR